MSSIEPSPKRTPSDTEPEHAKQEKPVTQPDATTANAGGPSGGQGKGKKVAKLVWPDMSPKQRAEKSETKAQAPREALKPGAGPAPQDPGKAVQNAGAQSKVDRAPAPAGQANPAPGHPPAHPGHNPQDQNVAGAKAAQAPREAFKPAAAPGPQGPVTAVQNAGAQSKVDQAPAPAGQANPAPGHPPAHPGHKPQDQNVAGAKAAQAPREELKPTAEAGAQGQVAVREQQQRGFGAVAAGRAAVGAVVGIGDNPTEGIGILGRIGHARLGRGAGVLQLTELVDQFYADVQQLGGRRWDTSSLIKRLA